ncbi:adenylate cyclase [Candidatus Moduliflexus flocculans]|uniref:Adenylate cyclase n=1 Tax=Candidatus Moduliflexus flocculans TaxID=1499966 RepID=A0A0S6VWE6_9BACT|nr:adenylate cyclase [Candidatus Moduliflexus flocculans]
MKFPSSKRFDLSLFTTVGFWSSVGLSLLIAAWYILSRPEIQVLPTPGLFEIIEARTLDWRFRLRGVIMPQSDIVIIAVDEKTEDALGRWQSSGRQWIAQLLNILTEGNAAVIGFDLTLAEPDERRDLQALNDMIERYQSQSAEKMAIVADLKQQQARYDYDRQLAEAIERAGNVVLGIYFLDAAAADYLTPEQQQAYQEVISRAAYESVQAPPGETAQPLRLPHASGVEINLPLFSEAALSFGHFNVSPDRDGVIRFTPLLEEYAGKYYPSLGLEVARVYLNSPLPPIIKTQGKQAAGNIEVIRLGNTLIPSDEKGHLYINYYGPAATFPYYSLADIISGQVPAYKFADKIVLLGFTSKIIRDLHATSFQSSDYPGVEVHATIIENILKQDFLIRPEWATLIEAGQILLLGLILGVVRYRKSPLWGVWAMSAGLFLMIGFAYAAFRLEKIWLNITFPALFIVADYLTTTSYQYFTEERQKRRIKHAFQYYVSPKVVEHLLQTADQLKLGGERRQLTAFFSDIRGFTEISEQMPPEQLVEFLNEYLSEMSQIALKYEGTIDKYMGDAIMAFYGAPMPQSDHAIRACKTAVDMIVRLKELRVGWEARGLPHMDIGIGINSGEMSVGNMGSRERFDYTIMGDNVNLASRLEGINKQYGTNIVISQFTYDLIKPDGFTLRELDTVCVKGKHEPVTIYELIGYGGMYAQKKPIIETFCNGLAAYKTRRWEEAMALFQDTLRLAPDDKPSCLYIERCAAYLQNPPPDDWNGVSVMTTK